MIKRVHLFDGVCAIRMSSSSIQKRLSRQLFLLAAADAVPSLTAWTEFHPRGNACPRPPRAPHGGVDLFEIAGIDPRPKKEAQAPAGDVDLFDLGGISIDVPKPKPQGIGGYVADAITDVFKRAGSAALSGLAAVPEAAKSSIRATVRSGAGGDPATVMPGGAFIPGIDTDEAINGPMAAQNPDKELWCLELPKKKALDLDTGLVKTMVDQGAKARDNVVTVRVGGKDRYIVFNERNEKAVRLAIAMKNLDAMELDRFTRGVAWITRWFASVNTQYNPVFGVMNLARDLQGAMLQLSTTPLAGKQAEVFRNIRRNTRAIYKDLRRERSEEGAGTSE